jgi:hypothetical protein
MASLLTIERRIDIRLGLAGFGDAGEPELPQASVARGGNKPVAMFLAQWLQPNAMAFEYDGCQRDHAWPRSEMEETTEFVERL